MQLVRVGARTDCTTRSANRGAWSISAHAHWCSTLCAVYAEGFALQYFSLTLGAHAQRGLQYLGLRVCLSVCLLSHISPTERLFVLKTLSRTQRATKVKKICGDLPQTTAFKSYAAKHERKSQYANFPDLPAVSFLRLTHSETPEGAQRLSTTFSLAQNDAYSTDAANPYWSEN